jgi:four helix bundle protein
MANQSFESLEVWKRGCRLARHVYEAWKDSNEFGLKDQMTRAAVSIPSDIAQGHERGSDADFVRFLKTAQGSAAELRTQAYIAASTKLLDRERAGNIINECKEIGTMLQDLAKSTGSSGKSSGSSLDDGIDFKKS